MSVGGEHRGASVASSRMTGNRRTLAVHYSEAPSGGKGSQRALWPTLSSCLVCTLVVNEALVSLAARDFDRGSWWYDHLRACNLLANSRPASARCNQTRKLLALQFAGS